MASAAPRSRSASAGAHGDPRCPPGWLGDGRGLGGGMVPAQDGSGSCLPPGWFNSSNCGFTLVFPPGTVGLVVGACPWVVPTRAPLIPPHPAPQNWNQPMAYGGAEHPRELPPPSPPPFAHGGPSDHCVSGIRSLRVEKGPQEAGMSPGTTSPPPHCQPRAPRAPTAVQSVPAL